MRPLQKIYLEITNACNLSCPFCPAHSRAPVFMSVPDFSAIMEKLRGKAESLYFHVKGEPLLHPELSTLIDIARDANFPVLITTNGTLLESALPALSGKKNLARLNVSLQSLAVFPAEERKEMIRSILESAEKLIESNMSVNPKFLVSLRLWTRDDIPETELALAVIEDRYGEEKGSLSRRLESRNGTVIRPGLAIHTASTFAWPSLEGTDYGSRGFCRALRDQAGILADGTVVPCCLDGDGILSLGNIFESSWDDILSSPRARAIYSAFTDRTITEPLCRRCGYRTRFGE